MLYDKKNKRTLLFSEIESKYRDYLDKYYEPTRVAFIKYVSASKALEKLDYIAYKAGLDKYIDDLIASNRYVRNSDIKSMEF